MLEGQPEIVTAANLEQVPPALPAGSVLVLQEAQPATPTVRRLPTALAVAAALGAPYLGFGNFGKATAERAKSHCRTCGKPIHRGKPNRECRACRGLE